MTFEAFMMSIFELADVWTLKPTKKQYADFLAMLFDAITENPFDASKKGPPRG